MSKKTRGNLMLLVTALIWGLSFVAQISGGKEIGAFTFNFSRNMVAGFSLWILMRIWPYIMKTPVEKETEEVKRSTILGGIICGSLIMLGLSLQQIGLTGVNATTAGKAGFITALYIVLVPLAGVFIGKKISIKIWLCVLLATVGLYLLSIKQGFSIQIGDLLVLISAFFFALHILVIDYFSPKSNGVKLSMIQFFVAAFLSGIVMIIFEEVSWALIFKSAVPILYAGMLSSGVGYTLQIIAQKDTEATIASLIMSLESVFALIAGVIILGERLNLQEAIGCAIMFFAIILAQIPSKTEKLKNVSSKAEYISSE